MRLSFLLLTATAAFLLTSSSATPTEPDKNVMVSPDLVQSIDAVQNGDEGKRFLRSHRVDAMDAEDDDDSDLDTEAEERVYFDPSRMLSDKTYRLKIFDRWLSKNRSSMWAYDKLDVNTYPQFRKLYNKYAKAHKKSGLYP